MAELEHLARDILAQGYLLSLATVDAQGVWVADVIYTYDDELTIYWMSKPNRRHSEAIDSGNNQVAGTITLTTGPGQADAGLQLAGQAQQVDTVPWPSVLEYFRKRQKPAPRPDDDILNGQVWYMMKPEKIELISTAHFGYERKKIR